MAETKQHFLRGSLALVGSGLGWTAVHLHLPLGQRGVRANTPYSTRRAPSACTAGGRASCELGDVAAKAFCGDAPGSTDAQRWQVAARHEDVDGRAADSEGVGRLDRGVEQLLDGWTVGHVGSFWIDGLSTPQGPSWRCPRTCWSAPLSAPPPQCPAGPESSRIYVAQVDHSCRAHRRLIVLMEQSTKALRLSRNVERSDGLAQSAVCRPELAWLPNEVPTCRASSWRG